MPALAWRLVGTCRHLCALKRLGLLFNWQLHLRSSPQVLGGLSQRHALREQHRPARAKEAASRSLAGELSGAAVAALGPLPAFTMLPLLVQAAAVARLMSMPGKLRRYKPAPLVSASPQWQYEVSPPMQAP